jgi:hypothetical protein
MQLISDVSLHIFKYLPITDIYSLGLVNKELYKGYTNELNWKNILNRDFIDDYHSIEKTNYETYKYFNGVKKIGIAFKLNKTNKKIVNLEILNLHNNKLQSLPPEIGLMANLQTLDLSYNQLQFLPAEIGSLVNLQYLSLNNNQLQSLPSEIGLLVNLQKLHLNDNQLQSLPAEIGSLVNLQKLYLDNHLHIQGKQLLSDVTIY